MKNNHRKGVKLGLTLIGLLGLIWVILFLTQSGSVMTESAPKEEKTETARNTQEARSGKIEVKIKAEPARQPEPENQAEAPPQVEAAEEEPEPAKASPPPPPAPQRNPGGRRGLPTESFAIVGDYRTRLGFDEYIHQMRSKGAAFYLYDRVAKDLKAEVDLKDLQFIALQVDKLRSMSPRVREIEKEPVVRKMLDKARTEYGAGLYSIILLVPAHLDNAIYSGIRESLKRSGINPDDVTQVRGIYESGRGSPLSFRATELFLKNGDSVAVNFAMNI